MEYEFESFDIDISHISNSDKVCWQYTSNPPDEEDWHLATDDMYCRLSPVTEALATSSDYVHIPKLKPSNVMEWFYRLDSLFDAGLGFLFTDTPEGEIPIRITINDLTDHLGLRINVSHWEERKFDNQIRNLRMKNNLRRLL